MLAVLCTSAYRVQYIFLVRKEMPREYGTHLYIIQAGEVCKVGRSMNVNRRFDEVSRSMPFADARLVATFQNAGFAEPWVLKALSQSYERRSEWFRCTPAQAIAAVSICIV